MPVCSLASQMVSIESVEEAAYLIATKFVDLVLANCKRSATAS